VLFGCRRYVLETLGNEFNVITGRPVFCIVYLVARRLSSDLKIHDIEWRFYVIFSLFRTAQIQSRAIFTCHSVDIANSGIVALGLYQILN